MRYCTICGGKSYDSYICTPCLRLYGHLSLADLVRENGVRARSTHHSPKMWDLRTRPDRAESARARKTLKVYKLV